MSKYYAVRNGSEGPQIYTDWASCQKAIGGFSGAQFRSFPNRALAQEYIATETDDRNRNKYYAVRIGIEGPKIYTDWSSCQKAVRGFNGAQFRSFTNRTQAEEYLKDTPKSTLEERSTTLDIIEVYTDGSCLKQGTPVAKAGAGVYFPQLNLSYSFKVSGKQTNNRAELTAVIEALRVVHDMKGIFAQYKDTKIRVSLDSEYVFKNLNSNNKCNLDLWQELKALLEKVPVEWNKVLAHSGIYGNEKADRLAKAIACE